MPLHIPGDGPREPGVDGEGVRPLVGDGAATRGVLGVHHTEVAVVARTGAGVDVAVTRHVWCAAVAGVRVFTRHVWCAAVAGVRVFSGAANFQVALAGRRGHAVAAVPSGAGAGRHAIGVAVAGGARFAAVAVHVNAAVLSQHGPGACTCGQRRPLPLLASSVPLDLGTL